VYEIPYIQSVVATHPYMVGRVIFGSLIIFAQPIFLYNMWMTARYGKKIVTDAGPRGAMPVPAAA
jgi:cytochrome c oxidase cbb3-type subunit 1